MRVCKQDGSGLPNVSRSVWLVSVHFAVCFNHNPLIMINAGGLSVYACSKHGIVADQVLFGRKQSTSDSSRENSC